MRGTRDGTPRAKSGARKAPMGGRKMVAEPSEEERRVLDRERMRRLLERAAHISEAPTPEIPPPAQGAHSPKYFGFLLALAEGLGPAAAARRAGYSQQSGSVLWRKPETQQDVRRIQDAQMEAHIRKINHLRGLALARAEDLLLDPETPPATVASLLVNIFDRSGLSAQHRVEIDATVRQAPMAAMTSDELIADLRLTLARENLTAEEIELKVIEARAMLPHDLG